MCRKPPIHFKTMALRLIVNFRVFVLFVDQICGTVSMCFSNISVSGKASETIVLMQLVLPFRTSRLAEHFFCRSKSPLRSASVRIGHGNRGDHGDIPSGPYNLLSNLQLFRPVLCSHAQTQGRLIESDVPVSVKEERGIFNGGQQCGCP